jgi:putative transport protein
LPNRSELIALSYGITYIWGTVGIIQICKYLSRWWGVDAKAAAKKYEEEFGVKDLEGGGLTGFRPFGLRAYAGKSGPGRPDHCRVS